jgi:purine nucleosidase
MARTRIIIDTDPGQDDAVALLLALAERDALDLMGITTVAGNVPLPLTTANALRILELANRGDVPVFPGASQPLLRELRTAEFVCGADGLEGAGLPPPRLAPQARHAVTFLIDTLKAAADRSVTLCPLGPLTNIALAFAQEPALASKVERIVLMGGARDLGNVTPAARIQLLRRSACRRDGPAAAGADRPLRPPCDASGHGHSRARRQDRRAWHAGGARHHGNDGPAAAGKPRPLRRAGSSAARPCVIAYLLWPDLFQGRDCHVSVETASEETMGRTTIDWWGSRKLKPNAHVIGHVDAAGFFERLTSSLARI